MLLHLLSTTSDWTQTFIRIILGVVFSAHGAQKLLGWFDGPGLRPTLRMMRESLGIPTPFALGTWVRVSSAGYRPRYCGDGARCRRGFIGSASFGFVGRLN